MIATQHIVDLADVDRSHLSLVGGKGANLGALLNTGFDVPPGFCLTTTAYRSFTSSADPFIAEQLRALDPDNTPKLEAVSIAIRAYIESLPVSDELVAGIEQAYHELSARAHEHGLMPSDASDPPVAVRSSATAEDLPDASFAGQQDTFLNVRGTSALLDATKRCWSSLWTSRAIAYRERNGFQHDQVALSVVVQLMIDADVSGILFTADPVNGYRTRMIANGAWGLGEAIVSGLVSPDTWTIDRAGKVIEVEYGSKERMIRYAATGGTIEQPVPDDLRSTPSLSDAHLRDLAALGSRAEAFFGSPQDLEWALAGGKLWLLQSRPITTLFPLPEPRPTDPDLHVYLSFNNLQGMLEPITPMGRDVFTEIGRTLQAYLDVPVFPPGKASTLTVAADRMFGDLTPIIRSPRGRRIMLGAFRFMDPQSAQAVRSVLDDPRLSLRPLKTRRETIAFLLKHRPFFVGAITRIVRNMIGPDRAVWRIEHEFQPRLLAILQRAQQARSLGERLLMIRILFRGALPLMAQYVPAAFAPGLIAGSIVERLVARWGVPDADLTQLRQGLPHNPTTEMDLALWQVSRLIVANAEARDLFVQRDPADVVRLFHEGSLPPVVQRAFESFLDQYGHRGVREIDIGMPRWAEDPSYIVGVLRSYALLGDPSHAPDRHFRQLQQRAAEVESRIVRSAQSQRGGWIKARVLRFLIRRLRLLAGLREGPKFWAIRVFRTVRGLVLGCGEILAQRGLIDRADDVFFLHLDELRAVDHGADEPLQSRVAERRRSYTQELQRHQVPRVVTSEGLVIYGRAQPSSEHMLAGVGVSPGVVQGHARIIRDPHGAQLTPGDILVAPSTDPAWTPLFLTAGGLVMEAGGMLSHGSVVAREYGIPAVVAVTDATTRLRDGQLIRIDGTGGVIELLPEDGVQPSA